MTEYVTVNEAARVFSCSPKTVRQMIARGELPADRLGRRWRIKKTDLDLDSGAKMAREVEERIRDNTVAAWLASHNSKRGRPRTGQRK